MVAFSFLRNKLLLNLMITAPVPTRVAFAKKNCFLPRLF
ncbi:hypothetical protein Lpl7_0173 [Lacticaseibacillus paracasei subsp. tolerans Lpl7]|nr:hypothetical protein Lpl7_0173 [Lacticaseibacillus paracasei subsp. tolerans Lpl7]